MTACSVLSSQIHEKETHLKIGQLLLQNTTFEENLCFGQPTDYGTDLLTLESEKYFRLNLMGQKAKAATAYDSAVRYLNVGLGLLSARSWHKQY